MDSIEIPDGLRISLNLFERELIPSIFVTAFLIGVGGYYLGGLLFSLLILANGIFLFMAY